MKERVVNKGDISLVSVPRLAPTKTIYINANETSNGANKAKVTGPNAIFVNDRQDS